ncbi:MAG: DnaB-like helicase C-terminal domain-containing protein [Candidatus Wallbacteria bacterium]
MLCKKCNGQLPESNFTGICGKCAFDMFQNARTEPMKSMRIETKSEQSPARTQHLNNYEAAAPAFAESYENASDSELSDEIEVIILNGFLNDQYLLGKTLNEGFNEKMLRNIHSKAIFKMIQDVYAGVGREKVVDPIIIRNKLEQNNLYDEHMKKFLNTVINARTPQLSQVMAYLKILREESAKNQLREISHKIDNFIKGRGDEAKSNFVDFSSNITKEIRDIQRSQTQKDIQLIKSQMIEIAQDINRREIEGEQDCLGFSVKPFVDLNSAISGLRNGFIYGIAGAPRRGKTNFTLELATLVATNNKIPVLFFTWEQTKKNLTYRLLSKETRINPDTLQRKRVKSSPENDVKFAQGWVKMEQYMDNLYVIEGTKEDTVDRIKAHAYNAMQDHQTDHIMIVCDYIQKMPLSKNYDSEKFRVEEISTDLKRLSIELNSPIIVISSLNKEGCLIETTENDDERPGLYHCKGSGDIEYDLDCAMILSKDWGDSKELRSQMAHQAEALGKDPIHLPKIDILNLHLDKNRDAPEGKSSCVQYFFFIEENRFFELGYKESTNAFRFNKIETLIKRLINEGYIKYRDLEGTQRGPGNLYQSGSTPSSMPEHDGGSQNSDMRPKIRLKR